ncbi:MAG: AmmeMemoRadiSam system radical SAM enzyme [Proteobacteria bacterium]|nr:AmmeMemoRadiSam system radical SAM enzyme [Pseudomonadota bacterium]MBU4471201.1 AmmeMemoRadiSam system radical SAM enzyme [Pseudomonadota bacterium]
MEALLYHGVDNGSVKCDLCSHRCLIKPDRRGICGVRENTGGVLNSMVFGRLVAGNIDPIEKKPLFHFLPGSLSYSIATMGCNFKCRFCQNADIAQPEEHPEWIPGHRVEPGSVVDAAIRGKCQSISYTYTEPTVFFEFARDTSVLAQGKGLKNIFVTNGYMSPEALIMIAPWLDAANVDLKAYSDDFYRTYCGAKLEPVKETLKLMKQLGIFVEVTTLLIPGLNDDPGELESLVAFLVEDLGPEVPWHISRFHPTYQLTDRPPTPLKTLAKAREIGLKRGLHHVYVGNVPGENGENTFCPACKIMLIHRRGFAVQQNLVKNGRCPDCGAAIPGVFQ